MNLQKMEKFTNMKYYVNSIRNEKDREIGASRRYGPFDSLEECTKNAEKLHARGYLYVEVMNDGGEVYCEYEN
jgi:hypothetical protein